MFVTIEIGIPNTYPRVRIERVHHDSIGDILETYLQEDEVASIKIEFAEIRKDGENV